MVRQGQTCLTILIWLIHSTFGAPQQLLHFRDICSQHCPAKSCAPWDGGTGQAQERKAGTENAARAVQGQVPTP